VTPWTRSARQPLLSLKPRNGRDSNLATQTLEIIWTNCRSKSNLPPPNIFATKNDIPKEKNKTVKKPCNKTILYTDAISLYVSIIILKCVKTTKNLQFNFVLNFNEMKAQQLQKHTKLGGKLYFCCKKNRNKKVCSFLDWKLVAFFTFRLLLVVRSSTFSARQTNQFWRFWTILFSVKTIALEQSSEDHF
jgi:hypothetical protein